MTTIGITRTAKKRTARLATPDAVAAVPQHIVVTGIPLRNAARLASLFWFGLAALLIVAFAITMRLLVAFGVVADVDRFVASLGGLKSFHMYSGTLFLLTALLAIVGATVATLLTVGSVALMNCLSGLVGGIEVQYREPTSDLAYEPLEGRAQQA
jgi:hypothetical protein